MAAAHGIPATLPGRLRPMRLVSDRMLAKQVAAGDPSAFDELYRRHHAPVGRFCRSLLLDEQDAQDALQNTMAAALRSLPGDTRTIDLRPWLFRVARNECVSMLRARRPAAGLDAVETAAQVVSDDERGEVAERLRQLVADLRSLPERQRSALVMRELSGLDYAEIAVALESSPAAAKQAVYEARAALAVLAEGRAMSCDEIRRQLSENDGRARRGRALRAHLRACDPCKAFSTAIGQRRADLALLAPPLLAPGAAGLAGMLGLGGGSSAAGGAAVKAAAVLTATATVAGGYTAVVERRERAAVPAAAPATATAEPRERPAAGVAVSPARTAPAADRPADGTVARRGRRGPRPASPASPASPRPEPARGVPAGQTPAAVVPGRPAPASAPGPERAPSASRPDSPRPGAAPGQSSPAAAPPAPGAHRPPVATATPGARPPAAAPAPAPPKESPGSPVAAPSPSVAPAPESPAPVVPDFRP